MRSPSSELYTWILCTSLMFSATCCHGYLQPPSSPRNRRRHNSVAFFIFGDSLFDAGNNNYLKHAIGRANFWPYGETFFNHPTGRFTDGRIMTDFLAKYAKLPLVVPYLQPGGDNAYSDGVNFASGGAGALVQTHSGQVLDLNTQLGYFKRVEKQLRQKKGDAETKTMMSKAIFFISIGGNDYLVPFVANSTMLQIYTKHHYVGMVLGNLTSVLTEIHRIGGRKFVFPNMGPLSRLPWTRTLNTESMRSELEVLEKLHNKALPKLLKKLQTQLKGFKYSLFDFHTLLSSRIHNPSKYGFKENTACCGSGLNRGILNCGIGEYELCENPSEYLFFDSAHPSDEAYSQFAEVIWDGSSNAIRPHNLKSLFHM